MALSSHVFLLLFFLGMLPGVSHAQTGQGAAGAATDASGIVGPAGASGITLTPQAPSFGNQGARQAPATGPTGTTPTATDPKAPVPRTGTSAEEQTSQRRQAQSGSADIVALPQLGGCRAVLTARG